MRTILIIACLNGQWHLCALIGSRALIRIWVKLCDYRVVGGGVQKPAGEKGFSWTEPSLLFPFEPVVYFVNELTMRVVTHRYPIPNR